MSDTLNKRAVEKAIKFLQVAGAKYTIDFGEEKFTNRPTRPDFKSLYGPIIDAAVAAGQSSISIQVPEDMDLEGFRSALAGAMSQRFGPDSSMSEVVTATRTVNALWADV